MQQPRLGRADATTADAVVAIVGDLSPDSVEVWVIDKVTGKSVVRRVHFEPAAARASTTLAIRAIELLRSSFLEIDLAAQGRDDRRGGAGAAPPPAVVHFVEMERLARHPERFGVEVGGAAIMSVDGVGLALLPLVAFDRCGSRVGMGGGFYDAAFASARAAAAAAPLLVGAAYEFQQVAHIEAQPWDIPLAAVVTERGVYHTSLPPSAPAGLAAA